MKKLLLTLGLILLLTTISYAAFNQYQDLVRTPHIGTIEIYMKKSVNPNEPLPYKIRYSVIVDDQFHNSMDVRNEDLAPHLTTAQKDQLIAFMNMLWQKAEDEILP